MTKLNDWTKGSLLGKVKTAHVEIATLSNNAGQWIEESRVPIMTTTYNEKGYVVKEVFYALDGNVSQVGFTKYDVDGNRTEVVFHNPNGGLVSLLVCDYDDNGKEIGCVYTSAQGLITKQKSVPVYDHTGNKADESWFYEDGTLSRKYTYKFHPDGRLLEQLIYKYADDGSLEEKRISIYSEEGNIVETSCLDESGQFLEGQTRYKYDAQGNETEVASYNPNGDLYSTTSYSYTLDSSGNWIRRTEEFKTSLSGFETQRVTYRTLTYY
jgi:hypothetical protein